MAEKNKKSNTQRPDNEVNHSYILCTIINVKSNCILLPMEVWQLYKTILVTKYDIDPYKFDKFSPHNGQLYIYNGIISAD